MKVNTAYTLVDQRGTLDTSHAQTLGIDVSGIAAILNILTNMYSNPSLAVVREYTCNARDSHVEAGVAHRPVEVTLPSEIDPQLRIQDWGIGLSKDEILNTYAKYGSSTKRESNELIGAMGIGSKSAFTVGNQFTVTGTKNGQKTVALFALNSHGEPTVDILFEGPTKEPNGVLVDIGVEDIDAVRTAAHDLFRTWEPGTVHVDGEQPYHVWSAAQGIGDGGYIIFSEDNLGWNESHVYVVMGGVSYRLIQSAVNSLSTKARMWLGNISRTRAVFYVNVPIGSVDITPSREDLRVTPTTTATLEIVINNLSQNLGKWISDQIQNAPTFTHAAIMVRKLSDTLNWDNYDSLTWRGKSFNNDLLTLGYESFSVNRRGYSPDYSYTTTAYHHLKISLKSDLEKYIFVTGVPDDKINLVRRYIKPILHDRGEAVLNKIVVASTKKSETVEWFTYGTADSPIESITYDKWIEKGRDLRKKANAGTVRQGPLYYVEGEDTPLTAAEVIATGEPVAYLEYKSKLPRDEYAKKAYEKYLLITLTKGQREDTLERRIPGAISVKKVINNYAESVINSMTPEDTEMINNNAYLANIDAGQIRFLVNHRNRITNEKVLELIKFHKCAEKAAAIDQARMKLLKWASLKIDKNLSEKADKRVSFVSDNLPLLALYLNYSWYAHRQNDSNLVVDHVLSYINNVSI